MRLLERIGLQLRISCMAALGLSAALTVFAFVGLRAVEKKNGQLQSERLVVAQTVAEELNRSLEHSLRLLAGTATREEMGVGDGDFEPARHVVRSAYLQAQLPTYRMLLLDSGGRVLLAEPDEVDSSTEPASSSSKVLGQRLIGLDLSSEDVVRASLLDGRPGVSGVLPASLLGQPVIVISVPVQDAWGKPVGALVQAVDLLELSFGDALRHTLPGVTGCTQLIDEDGTVIASTRPQVRFQEWEYFSAATSLVAAWRPGVGVYPMKSGRKQVDPSTSSGQAPSGILQQSSEPALSVSETRVLVAFAPLSAARWAVSVEQEVGEVLVPIQRLRQTYFFLGLAAVVITLGLVWIATRRVVQPVREVSAAARRIAHGELGAAIGPQGEGEVGELVRAFDDMRVSLAAWRAVMKLHTRDLSVLRQSALACAEASDADELATRVTDSLVTALEPRSVGFLFFGQEQKRLHFHPSYHGVAPEILTRTFGLGEGISGTVAQTGKPLLIPNLQTDPHCTGVQPAHGAALCVPVRNGGRVAGVIKMENAQPGAFSRSDLHLVSALAIHVGIALENIHLYQEMRRQAITDGLTGLFNNRYFYQEMERELMRGRRYGHSCSLLILDLDDFKKYNDRYGHLAGDDLLRKLGDLMRSLTRQVDTVARYGGEEFTVILPETDNTDAIATAERLRETIRSHEFVIRATRRLTQVTVSIGVATYPEHAHNVEGLVHAADLALLKAKEVGKDRVCVAVEVS